MANWGEGAKGAAGGAALGGSLGGPLGAAAGGIIGGALGLFGGDDPKRPEIDRNNFNVPGYQSQYNRYGNIAANSQFRTAPQAGQSGFRGDQTQLARMLMAQAQGQGPGQQLARQHAQQMADRGVAQQMAMAQSGRPGGGALAARRAAMNAGDINAQATQSAVMGGLQAQLGATGQLGNVLQGARQQDFQRASFNADARLRQTGMNDQREMEALAQRLRLAEAQQRGGMNYEKALQGNYEFEAGQPGLGDRLLGMGGNMLTGYMMQNAGRKD